jgi:hypothetical protein
MSTAPESTRPQVFSRGLPAPSGQAAVVLGFLLGTWMLVDGLTYAITGAFLPVPATMPPAPGPAMALLTTVFGALWMLVPNLFLFQNRLAAWKAMLILVVATSWYLGAATPLLLAQLVLLLLPATRHGLR